MFWLLPTEDDNAVRHTHWVLYLLIGINLIVFASTWSLPDEELGLVFDQFALIPAQGQWHQWLTSTFLHAGFLHIAGNMFFLWLFGDNIEDVLGHVGFLLVYLLGGLAGTLLFVSSNPGMLTPSVGASGCVAAVAGVYAVMFAGRPVTMRVIFIVFPIWRITARAFWILLFWFGLDLAQAVYVRGQMTEGGGINFVVHGGGFAFGLLLGLVARMHGVLRRYEALADGDFLFGYWPQRLEREERLRSARRAARNAMLARSTEAASGVDRQARRRR